MPLPGERLVVLGGVAAVGFRTGFRCRKTGIVGLSLGCACGVTTVALHSNYEYAWYVPEVQRLFFANAALIAGCMAIAARTDKENRNARRLRAAARTIGPAAPVGRSKGQGTSYGN